MTRTLAVLVPLTTLISACATAPSSIPACPREVEYTAAQQIKAADELLVLPESGMIRGTMMPDYGRLRAQARACRGEK